MALSLYIYMCYVDGTFSLKLVYGLFDVPLFERTKCWVLCYKICLYLTIQFRLLYVYINFIYYCLLSIHIVVRFFCSFGVKGSSVWLVNSNFMALYIWQYHSTIQINMCVFCIQVDMAFASSIPFIRVYSSHWRRVKYAPVVCALVAFYHFSIAGGNQINFSLLPLCICYL